MKKKIHLFLFSLLVTLAFWFRGSAQAGTLDLTFDPALGFGGFVHDIALQPDGKILFTGSPWGTTDGLARLNPDGSIDTTFQLEGTGFEGLPHAVVVQPDGKIITAGLFNSYN